MAGLRLAVLVHEGRADDIRHMLRAARLLDLAPLVAAVVGSFGALWKATSDDDLRRYVHLNRTHLAGLLLFELAHEGRPTAEMARAAALGGLTARFERWATRLAGRTT